MALSLINNNKTKCSHISRDQQVHEKLALSFHEITKMSPVSFIYAN